MPTREEAIAELYRRDLLKPEQKAAVEELAARGKIDLGPDYVMRPLPENQLPGVGKGTVGYERSPAANIPKPEPAPEIKTLRQQMIDEVAQEVGPLKAFTIGMGKGLYDIGRGTGVTDPASEVETETIQALKEKRPISTTAGELTGQTLPFLIPGAGAGAIPSTVGRTLAMGALGGTEGGIIAKGTGQSPEAGILLGTGFGMGAEIFIPILARLGSKIVSRVTGKAPKGAMLDLAGNPTRELQDALDRAGITFDDLTEDAIKAIQKQKPGVDPDQVARKALFESENIPASKGEITKDPLQLKEEQRLLASAVDEASAPFNEFKLQQSEAIKNKLKGFMDTEGNMEATGQMIFDALTDRKDLLTKQKNDLYSRLAKQTDDIGEIPLFVDDIKNAIPDDKQLRRWSRFKGNQIEALNDLLVEFGITDNEDAIKAFIASGGEVTPLSVNNFNEFRQALNQIIKADRTGITANAALPIKEALDAELEKFGRSLPKDKAGFVDTFKQTNKIANTLKTEFSPQSIIGRVIDTKKDGVTQVTEASKIYNKLASKANPVESVRKVVKSLANSGEKGEQALSALQATTILDLLEAGFKTESRQIKGVKVFNPQTFKTRMKQLGEDKLEAIFIDNPEALKSIKNIDKIASSLVPPAGTVPKGSGPVILDLAAGLGLTGIAAKFPGGAFLVGALRGIGAPIKKAAKASKAMTQGAKLIPKRSALEKEYPALFTATAMPIIISQGEEK